MKEQNFKNHIRLVAGYHGITFFAIIALMIGSGINLCNSTKENVYSASLICLIAVILGLFFWYMRSFALRAQDRAIRAEENFRHFILTGKPLNNQLRLGQIIALRFAADTEFIALAERAVAEKMSPTQIKQAIVKWRPDFNRV